MKNPKTFNEKIQWLKLHDRNPEYTKLVDKYEVRKYISEVIGEEYLVPLLGVWDSFDEIDFSRLPDKFVLKCTHDSGSTVICKDKDALDLNAVKEKLNKCLKRNFYYPGREWPYKNVKPRIIAEEYLEESSGQLMDYKFFCFDGDIKLIQVDYDRFTDHKRNLYTPNWILVPASIQYPSNPDIAIEKPRSLETMLKFSKKISKGFPHVRADWYCIDTNVYFGELTLYHGGGTEKFTPETFGEEVGGWIKLPKN